MSNQRDAYVEARRALLECEEQHAGDTAACAALAEEATRRYSEYEARAQSSWGCANAPDRCADVQRPGR